MSIKNILRKAAELVVELPADERAPAPSAPMIKSVEQILKETPGPSLKEVKIPEPPSEPTAEPKAVPNPMTAEGVISFPAVYERAGLPAAPFSAEQAFEVMSSLPKELPMDVKRSTVQATLVAMGKAMGVSTETVVADAGRKLAALAAYEDLLTHQAEAHVAGLQVQIAELEKQVALHRQQITKTQDTLAAAIAQCDRESERLDDVLEFFTLDQGASRNAPA